MKILINTQVFNDDMFYQELINISRDDNISSILLASSLMNDLKIETIEKYNNINKVKYIDTNTLFTTKNFSNKSFKLSSSVIEKQDGLYSDLLSSFRWMPISKRKDNDSLTFSMVFYYDTYNFWNSFFNKNKVDSIILLQVEHSSLDSILVRVAKKYNIKNILTTTISGWQASINEEYYTFYDNRNEIILQINDTSDTYKKNYNYESKQNHSKEYEVSILDKIKTNIDGLSYLIKGNDKVSNKVILLKEKILNKISSNFKLMFQLRYIKKLRKYYEEISNINVDLTKKYIYYCLHFDPEATTLPKDTIYSNQLLNIRIISSSLPEGWTLYVKEHPHQLNIKLFKSIFLNQLHSIDLFRSKSFYNYINSLKNVKLISLNINHKKLIENAEYIVSNTGTVFREATKIKKRCLTFSSKSIYLLLNNVYKVKDFSDCTKLFNNNPVPIYQDVDDLFEQYTLSINNAKKRNSILLKFIIKKELYKLHND